MKRTLTGGLHQLVYLTLAMALTFTACKKGDTGPKGDKGDTGDKGANGSKGDKGDPGSANVFYSAWKDITFQLNSSGTVYVAELTENKITTDILTNGEIKTYINLGTATAPVISPLPYVEEDVQIRPYYFANTIHLEANVNASTVTSNGVKSLQYRYLIIPGGQAIRMSQQVNWNNYAEVKAYLGLKD
jgi:hypothetical protein